MTSGSHTGHYLLTLIVAIVKDLIFESLEVVEDGGIIVCNVDRGKYGKVLIMLVKV